jgi:hypothetical protein
MENQLQKSGNLLDNLDSDAQILEEETTEQMFETLMQKMALLKRSLARKKCTNQKNPEAFEEVINDPKDIKLGDKNDKTIEKIPKSPNKNLETFNFEQNESFNDELNNTLSTIKTGITMSHKDLIFEQEQVDNQQDKSFSTDVSIVNMIGKLSLSDEDFGNNKKKGRKSNKRNKKPSELATYLHKLKNYLHAAWMLVKRKKYRLDERQVTFFLEFFVVNHNYKEEIDIIFEFFFKLVEVKESF